MLGFNSKILRYNHKWLDKPGTPPPRLYRIRVRTNDGESPDISPARSTADFIEPVGNGVYDVFKYGDDLSKILWLSRNTEEIIEAEIDGVKNLTDAFSGCWNLKYVNDFDTSTVENMSGIFRECISLTETLDLNTSNVTNMHDMYMNCTGITTINQFDTSKATNMSGMFGYTRASSCPLLNTSSCTNMEAMFYASRITSLPLFDTSNVTNMWQFLAYNRYIEQVPAFDLHNVLVAQNMFRECTALKSLPDYNLSRCYDMVWMCYGCTSLTALPNFTIGTYPLPPYDFGIECKETFSGCTNVASGITRMYNKLAPAVMPGETPSPYSGCFYNCGSNTTAGAAELAQIPSDWK